MGRALAVALALSICACAQTDLLRSDAGSDTDTASPATGDLLWAAAIEFGMASDIVALPDGDLIAVGTNGDGAAFFGAASGEIAVDPAGVFLARYTSFGEIAAVESPILGRGLTAHAVRAAGGALFLSGAFNDAATFGPGSAGEVVFLPQGDDGYAARLDGEGVLAWVARVSGSGYDSAIDVGALTGGGAAAVGTFGFVSPGEEEPGTATVADGYGDETPLVSAGGGDAFAARFGPGGELTWIAAAGGAGFDLAYAVAGRPDGSIAIAGEYGNNGNLSEGNQCTEPGEPAVFGVGAEAIALAPAGATDGFVASYSADGALLWARDIGGPCMDWIRDVVTLEDGSVVAIGVIGGPALFGAGEANETEIDCGELETCDDIQRVFLAAFDASGDLEWVRTSDFCTDDHFEDYAIDIRADQLAVGPDGALAIAGGYQGACSLGPGEPGETQLPYSNIAFDPLLAAFAPDGALAWVATGAGPCDDVALASAFAEGGSLISAGVYSAGWSYMGHPCSGALALGAGEAFETTLPGPPWPAVGQRGFVALFAGK